MARNLSPSFETRPKSTFARVYDSLRGAPQDEVWVGGATLRASGFNIAGIR